jgi:hypothetical protein
VTIYKAERAPDVLDGGFLDRSGFPADLTLEQRLFRRAVRLRSATPSNVEESERLHG